MKEARYDEDQVAWNPSRLVMGTNAVLKVGANGDFSPSEVRWSVVSGPGVVYPTNGWETTVTPTGPGTVTVEARFNGDEIQPRFVLPVVQPRTIPVRAFVVQPPTSQKRYEWTNAKIDGMLDTANEIFTQVGIRFELAAAPQSVGSTNDWNLLRAVPITNVNGRVTWRNTSQYTNLVSNYTAHDCIKVYFLGALMCEKGINARKTSFGLIVTKAAGETTLAHELGHALGLDDCYWFYKSEGRPAVYMPYADEPVDHAFFLFSERDWGEESGRGFYEKSDTRRSVMSRMLMHGFNMGTRADIPNSLVFSLRRKAISPQQTTCPRVGADRIAQQNLEVYSR